ncbi:hypothetical protein ASPZODRAFT_35913, partial [Penicilliopsis zonata CBS 506.65]
WQQRKVLEQLVFHLILSKINTDTNLVIAKIRLRLNSMAFTDRGENIFSGDLKPYFECVKTWAELHAILEVLIDSLESISNNVREWGTREQDRRTEKPRWSSKDERKYRDAVNQMFCECQKDERGLLASKSAASSLLKALNYRREQAKNSYDSEMTVRGFNQNDNIKYFTYSTVIFLPLGFAASVYSMQAAPPTDVLQHMVICSIVAFFVLLVILFTFP